jgi:membrane protease YdiL (CAAX protease family)
VSSAFGLAWCPWFYRDIVFAEAVLAALGFWLGLWLWFPVYPITLAEVLSPTFLSLVVWQPLLEELLFRGYCQGQLHRQSWGQRHWRGLTVANGLTSLLFVAGHYVSHPPLWATAVLLPSLLLGYCRDRYGSVYPSIILHAFYNAGDCSIIFYGTRENIYFEGEPHAP